MFDKLNAEEKDADFMLEIKFPQGLAVSFELLVDSSWQTFLLKNNAFPGRHVRDYGLL